MNKELLNIKQDINKHANPSKAKVLQRFFKTGKGEYGEGDQFLGIIVPIQRKIAKKYRDLDFESLQNLLESNIHEYRLIALFILVYKFEKSSTNEQKVIFDFYLSNLKYINNWDLVDLSADKIVGEYLADKDKSILFKLSKSKHLWSRRISILASFNFIKKQQPEVTLQIAQILINDHHDLIQKAVGWMLREVGKRCSQELEEEFLQKNFKKLSRTTLRYAIEHFGEEKRKKYLSGLLDT